MAKLRPFVCQRVSRMRENGPRPLRVEKNFQKIFFAIFQNFDPHRCVSPIFTKIDDIVVSKCKIILGFVLELPFEVVVIYELKC